MQSFSFRFITIACRLTRQGQALGTLWVPRLEPYVAAWNEATLDVVTETRPHSDAAFTEYLRWYLSRTRVRVTYTPQDLPRGTPLVTDTYPRRRDQRTGLAVSMRVFYLKIVT